MTHPHAMISFALSRDGRQLATGSECGADGDYESPVVGVVLWDVATGSARHVVPVEGGIGLGDQLRRGLAFCADGTTLAYNYFTNLVGALDTQTAQVRLEAVASDNDPSPTLQSRVTTVPSALAVLWPDDDVMIAIGPQVLAFLRVDGTAIARLAFPT